MERSFRLLLSLNGSKFLGTSRTYLSLSTYTTVQILLQLYSKVLNLKTVDYRFETKNPAQKHVNISFVKQRENFLFNYFFHDHDKINNGLYFICLFYKYPLLFTFNFYFFE